MNFKIRMNDEQHMLLKKHLLNSDGNEAVAIALCGRSRGNDMHCLLIRELFPVPYKDCIIRDPDLVRWKTIILKKILPKAMEHGMGIVKIHSHPSGYSQFSTCDDNSDRQLFSSILGWIDDDRPHASLVMLPDGSLFGRFVDSAGGFHPIRTIMVAGEDIRFWHPLPDTQSLPDFSLRNRQAFGLGTTQLLSQLSIAVVGCSGTGSPVIEQLARLGVGRLVLIDPDRIEEKNLNRILNSGNADVLSNSYKVDIAARSIENMSIGTIVKTIPENLCDVDCVRAVAECDIVFGCMDGSEGRHLLNRIATFYQIPYFDVGVKLEADGAGNISQICGSVHYLQPGKSSLLSRKAITLEAIEAEGMKRTNPDQYEKQVGEKYIKGINVDSPAVISVNMHYASLAVLEFLARIHSFRDDSNCDFAQFGSSLTQSRLFSYPESEKCPALSKHLGKGDITPLLDMSILSN